MNGNDGAEKLASDQPVSDKQKLEQRDQSPPEQPVTRQSRAARRASTQPDAGQAKRYKLNENAHLTIERGDLTRYAGDAIVNAANEYCLGGGGVDGAIHKAAGDGLYLECRTLPLVAPGVRCPVGEAKITGGHDLPARYVIHAVGPIYDKDEGDPDDLLYSAYKSSLDLANEKQLKTIAFPAISCGIYGYPIDEAAEVAVEACMENVGDLQEINLIQFSLKNLAAFQAAASDVLEEIPLPTTEENQT